MWGRPDALEAWRRGTGLLPARSASGTGLPAHAAAGGIVSGAANLQPFGLGNDVGRRHAFYAEKLSLSESAEVVELAETLIALSPLAADWGPRLQPLAQLAGAQLWRLRRAYADLEKNGLTRAYGKPAPILPRLEALERQLMTTLDRLGLTPQAAADLGLTMARVRELEDGRAVDLERLDTRERSELARLIAKAKGDA